MPQVSGIAPRVRVGRSRWFNLLWLLPIGFVAADRRGGGREGPARRAVGPAVHRPVPRHARLGPDPGDDRVSRPGLRWQHFFNLFFMIFIIRVRGPDPVRPSAPVLDPALHPGQGLVPDPETGAGRSAVDGQAGLDQPARAGRPARASPLDRPGPLVASRRRRAVAAQRRDLLRPAVRDRPWQRLVPTSWGVFPNAAVGADPVPVAELAGRERLGGLQRPAADRLLHHRLRRRPAGADHRAGHVTRAVDPLQAGQQGLQHPDRPLAALPRARLVPGLHRDPRDAGVHHRAAGQPQPRLRRTHRPQLGRVLAVRGVDGGRHRRLGGAPPRSRSATPGSCSASGQAIVGPLQHLFEHVDPKPGEYSEKDISPYFWHNGQYPDSDEYKALFDGDFADYRLRIHGLVENPVELDLAQLRALPHHEQITQHFCIQGWSGIAKWGGVSMQTIVDLVKPQPEAKWVVFYSLGEGADKGVYYDAHPIEHMSHHLTMLAYDMNDEPLSFGHGAPLRLRNEIELGFKQVKWIKGIEFVAHYSEIGSGYGGYNQDHEFFGYRQSI